MTTTDSPTAQPQSAAVADWVDPETMLRDPYPTYRRLREQGPVVWVPVMDRYLVTSFTGCWAIEADQLTYSASVGGSGATMARALGAQPMLRKDDPEHAAERKTINPCMRPKNVRQNWLPLFERNAETHLAALLERGPSEADLNRDYAAPLAAQNLIDMLGLQGASPTDMTRWSHAFIAGIGNIHDDPEIWARCEAAQAEVDALLDELIPYYRNNPDGSVTSAMVTSSLPEAAVRANVKLTISGGMNEPQHMVTNIVWALSRHPEQRNHVLADPSRWPTVFDEAVRWLSPIGMYPRQTTRETVLEGIELPAGAGIGVVVGAANRDPAAFDHADEFDFAREKKPHLGFGAGAHLCAGHWAARISIGEVAAPLLYRRIPRLTTDPHRAEQWNGWVFRGLTELPVTWEPA
ncbi:cytochrome P450 [Nocardiopsis sp. NRRL B-16309]|uniref:cytochrome P450 n=1 Tax=Nocardiopsis sp. NRRL B-16309 TaxID=1519494 RepID=UPI0006AEE8E0|nr:cytochrome P450 [Nocardiopsis sp. NRRL B-16309]KOX12671.1 cytochrome P450 [Nocardiopsis sp. NRRL B-16309]